MQQTTNRFAAYMQENYSHNELADICNHGCASCAPAGMIYYSETTEIFIQYRDDLFEIMSEYTANVGGNGLPDYVLNNSETFTSFANAVVWFCAESVALYATDGAYIDDTEEAA